MAISARDAALSLGDRFRDDPLIDHIGFGSVHGLVGLIVYTHRQGQPDMRHVPIRWEGYLVHVRWDWPFRVIGPDDGEGT